MRKKNVLLAFVLVLLLLAMFGTRITMPVSASTVDVYFGESIQAAINSAQPGDTIFVHEGIYYEQVKVNKTASLVGENPATTIIDGSGNGIVIKVTVDNINVTGFTIQNAGNTLADCGVYLGNCTGNTISNNIIRNSAYGTELFKSNGSSIIGNIIINNSWAGIHIHDSNENIIYDNIISNNSIGAWISSSDIPNTFYHNNFINNPNQASDFGPSKWDNGTEGNYWSDYMGMDTNGDGIGDTGLPHQGDSYPLIIPTRPFPVVLDDIIYPVALLSNSTVSEFYFSKPLKRIGFNVTGSSGTIGFCNVTIPLTLMWCNEPQEWQVTVGGNSPTYFSTPTNNGTHTFLYFTYNQSTKNVKITSIYVAPEFPAAIVLPLFIIVTLVAVTLRKKKKRTFKF